MSVLTWRDVATPDLAPASQGIANATDAMNRAFASAAGTIDTFKDQRANAADRNIINRSIQYQNPEDLAAALHDGSIVGQDGQYAHAGVIAGLRSQVTDLLANALTKTQTSQDQANIGNIQANTDSTNTATAQTKILNARANADDAAWKSAEPTLTGLVTKYTPLGAAGITDATKELENSPAFAALNPAQQALARQHLYSSIAAPVNAGNSLYNDVQAGVKAKAQVESDAVFKQITSDGGGAPNIQAARAQMLAASKNMTPEAYQLLVQKLKPVYGDLEQNPLNGLNLTTEGIPGAGVSDLSQYGRKYGDNTFSYGKDGFDPTQHSVQDVLNYQKNVMIPANAGKVGAGKDGSGAIGAYQQTYGTLQNYAAKVFPGQDLSKIQFTPQVQEKLAEAQFNDVKNNPNGDLRAIWPSLTVQEAAQLKGMTWDQAAPYISAGESGSGKTTAAVTLAMQNRVKAFDANNVLQQAIAKQSANGFIKDYNDAANDTTNAANPGAVAVGLVKSRSELAKANVDNLTGYIADVMKQANVSAPVAGAIIANSLEQQSWTGNFFDRHFNNDGITAKKLDGGFEINRTTLANNIKLANNPEIKQGAASLNFSKENVNRLTDAQTRFTAAQQELVKVAAWQRASPDDPQLKDALAKATSVFQDAYQAVNGIQNNVLNSDAQAQAAKQPKPKQAPKPPAPDLSKNTSQAARQPGPKTDSKVTQILNQASSNIDGHYDPASGTVVYH